MGQHRHIKTYSDTQRSNPVLKKIADIVKEHDMAGAILIVIEKDDNEDFQFLSYNRPGYRKRMDQLIGRIDRFIRWLWCNGERFN